MKNILKKNPTSTTKRKNNCDQNNDEKKIIKYIKKIKKLLNMHAIVVKHVFCISNFS